MKKKIQTFIDVNVSWKGNTCICKHRYITGDKKTKWEIRTWKVGGKKKGKK